MRRLLFVVAIAGCTHAATLGPQWPKTAATDSDGGESIAPREAAKSIVAETDKDDDADDAPAQPATPATETAAAAATDSAPAASTPPATDEPIQTEEIVIEVGPDD